VQVPIEVADWIAEALRESQDDKARLHRTAAMQHQQQHLALRGSRIEPMTTAGRPNHGRTLVEQVRGGRLKTLVSISTFDRGPFRCLR
jgi:hypothetical protein